MKIRLLFSEVEIAAALRRMAGRILDHYGEKEPVMVLALMNGALWFAADLLRCLPVNFLLESVWVSSYGDARETSGLVEWKTPVPDCAGKRVLVLDDVLDSGITLTHVKAEILRLGATEVQTAVMMDKPSGRRVQIEADYVGLNAPAEFLVGYGMDVAGRCRNLPYIGAPE